MITHFLYQCRDTTSEDHVPDDSIKYLEFYMQACMHACMGLLLSSVATLFIIVVIAIAYLLNVILKI